MSDLENCELHYLDNIKGHTTWVRGEPIKMALEDAGVKFEYKGITLENWPTVKQKLLDSGCRVSTMPYIITKSGKFYATAAPLLRLVSRKINKFMPEDVEDEYLVDAYSDLYLDWYAKWLSSTVYSNDEALEKDYVENYRVKELSNWNNVLGDKQDGPYILGSEISYCDFLLYHILYCDCEAKIDAQKYPNLASFVQAIESRSTLRNYFSKRQV